MDEEHCVIAVPYANLRDSYSPQINAVTTSFLHVLSPPAGQARPLSPVALEGLRRSGNDGAKIRIFFEPTKKDLVIWEKPVLRPYV